MYRTFNCGLGYLVVVDATQRKTAYLNLQQQANLRRVVGRIESWDGTGEPVTIV